MLYTVLAVIMVATLLFPMFSNAQLPFGGMVTLTQPCNNGLLLTVLQPLSGTQQFMWTYGNLPFNWHVIPHVGQEMLGNYLVGTIPCTLGNTTVGQGSLILFHGSSI